LKPNLKLKATRVEKGQLQSDVARILKVSEQTYNQKELGKRDFTLRECKILARHFNKTMDEIFFADQVNNNKTMSNINKI